MANEGGSSSDPGRSLWAWVLLVLGGLAVAAGVVALVWLVPVLFYSYVPEAKDRAAAEATTRTGMLAGLAGLAAFATFWLNRRVYQVTARTFEVTEQGHITDRYTKAIGQLGDDKLDIRLGGIYALERLAIDSKRDHPTVVEVLSAFVRERSGPAGTQHRPVSEVSPVQDSDAEQGEANRSQVKQPAPGTDVQAALSVLGRLPMRADVSRGDLSGADLTGANLTGGILPGVNLGGATLTNARLGGANLADAYLPGATLVGADLPGANLTNAYLLGANLTDAKLTGANLTDAYLPGATLTNAHLPGANLTNAYLLGANLTDAYLPGATLTNAHLTGANLTNAYLSWANLADAKLNEANLTNAILSGATLTNARLGGANLTDAHLTGANLTGAEGLAQAQIAGSFGNPDTRLPSALQHPDSWAKR